MSDIAKWALLVAGALAIIAAVTALPFVQYINGTAFASSISTIIQFAGSGFTVARGLINNFLTSFGRNVLTGLIYWLFGKWAIMNSIKFLTWAYHFIFK